MGLRVLSGQAIKKHGLKVPLGMLVAGMLAFPMTPSHVEAASCTVQINSEPQGANVYVNNKLQGSTPHEMKLPSQRAQYELRIKLRGHEEYKTTVSCASPPSEVAVLSSLPRIDVRIVFPSHLKYEGCGARVAINWRSGRYSLARMELFPGDEKSYSGYKGEYMTLTHSGYFFCPTDVKPYCLGKSHETEVIFDRAKSYEVTFKGDGDKCKTELVER